MSKNNKSIDIDPLEEMIKAEEEYRKRLEAAIEEDDEKWIFALEE